MRRAAIGLIAVGALLAGCSSGSGPATITIGPARSAAPPAPPADALTLAGHLRFLGVAVAVTPRRMHFAVRVSVLGSQGYGVNGLRVRVAGTATTPCGAGCYTGTAPLTAKLRIQVGPRSLAFVLPRPPFRSGTALLRRINARYVRARTAVFHERLSSGPGQVVTSSWHLAAPSSLSYTASDGSSGIVIGTRRWDKQRGGRWQESPQDPSLPQPALPWTRSPTNVTELAPGRIDGRRVVRVSFLDPRLPAWYTVSATPGTHELVRLEMVATAHFMRDDYRGLDVPLTVSPPRK
jgi:hypothetical protein